MRALVLLVLAVALPAADGTLVVRVTDRATGRPLAARVSLKASDGQWRWGKDLKGVDLAYGGTPRLWANGTTSATLPAGPVEVVVSRPFHHRPFLASATIAAGRETAIDAVLEPVVDLHALGWYGGDIHVHIVHGERDFAVDLASVAPIARAEGQDWCSFGQEWTALGERQPTPDELAATCRWHSDADFLCAWGMEHPKDHLGHMAAFPLATPLLYAEASGANPYDAGTPAGPPLAWTHLEIWRGLRAHGGLAVYTHPTREYGGVPESLGNLARELPFDVLAAPDWLEALDILCDQPRHERDEALAYYLLNRGLRFAICGFTDVCYDRKRGDERPGDTRTYVHLGDRARPGAPLAMADIVAAVRARRTFASNGPLVDFRIDGELPGSVLRAGPQARRVRIGAWLALDYDDPRRPVRVEAVEVLRNGKAWRRFARDQVADFARLEFDLQEAGDAWYIARVLGPDPLRQVAVTSPIWFATADPSPAPPLSSHVTAKVVRAGGDAAPSGIARVIEYAAGGSRELSRTAFTGGGFALDCPAACRVEVLVDGCQPLALSPFLHGAVYRTHFLGIRRASLTSDAFYDAVKAALAQVELEFALQPR
jgi:hypothetical protein